MLPIGKWILLAQSVGCQLGLERIHSIRHVEQCRVVKTIRSQELHNLTPKTITKQELLNELEMGCRRGLTFAPLRIEHIIKLCTSIKEEIEP